MLFRSLATGGFALAYALMLGSEGGLEGYFRDFVAKFLRTVRDAVESDASSLAAEVSLPAAETIAKFLPGAFAATWLGVTFANGALGQLLARISGRALRPSPEMADIELPTWVPGLAAIAAVGAMLPGDAGFVGVTVATILGLAFVFAGLAVVHARSRTWPQRRWWLGTIYLLSLTQGWPFLLVALLGVVEPWTNLRGRPAATPPGT